ncbi:thiolase family protein [Roseomonas chloroacetimidivorans]|uniref:thiolase family protein n=1 Tax=Roseomonas chloroacetimidivorans TaxID=1766656 RepID=UPI003C724E7C
MRGVTLLGAAALPCGKWQSPPDAPERVLEHEVLARLVIEAMEDAGVGKEEVGSLCFAQCRPYTLQKYFATFMAHYLRIPLSGGVGEILGNGMTAGLAFERAVDDILLGKCRVALALGVNFETATPAAEHMMSSMRAVGDVDFQAPFGISPIAWYAMDAARYMHEHGATRAEIASVAVKNRRHAAHNPLAQFRRPVTLEEVLAQPMIVEPLGLYEVPPRSDGAVCLVLAEEEVARATGRPYARLRGRGFHHEGAHQISEVPNDMIAFDSLRIAGPVALASAGIGPGDLDFAELYAPCTIVEVLACEALGLVPRGEGAARAAAGDTALGGRIPVCTSGGLLSRGHPAYVTPFYGLVEALDQLRGRAGERQVAGARLGLTTAELGNYNAALVHVLEAVR